MREFFCAVVLLIVFVAGLFAAAGLDYYSSDGIRPRHKNKSQLGISPRLWDAEKTWDSN